MGRETHPDHLRAAVGPQHQRAGKLSSEEAHRLATPTSVLKGLERLFKIENQLRAAVRNYPLHASVFIIDFERPVAFYETAHRFRRCEFAMLHSDCKSMIPHEVGQPILIGSSDGDCAPS